VRQERGLSGRGTRIAAVAAASAALLAASCSGSSSNSSSVTSDVSTSVAAPAPATGLAVKQVGAEVRVRWTAPSGPSTGFEVIRNGILKDEQAGTSWADTTIKPGHAYVYKVVNLRNGKRSAAVTASIKTVIPPLRLARLGGLYSITSRPTHVSGLKSAVKTRTFGWRFHPRCAVGACSTRWGDGARTALARRAGTTYSVTYTGYANVTCDGHHATGTTTITLRVVAGAGVNGQWKAKRITGTMDTETPAQLGCVSASEIDSLTGTLYGA
jgi:hypothetical protein